MGKRSDFERHPRSFYPTPWVAFEPLIPYLPEAGTHIGEPCAGDGLLCSHLVKAGLHVAWAGDIHPLHPNVVVCDAREVPADAPVDMFITNPPWPEGGKGGEPTLEILRHLSSLRPTWALLHTDIMFNTYATPAMAFCHRVVTVGRVKWRPDTKWVGKENCAWLLFDQSRAVEHDFFVPRQPRRRAA